MKRGDLYRVRRPSSDDPKRSRVFVVVSRQATIDSLFSSVVCAPVYSRYDGLSTQVEIGIEQGLTHDSSIHCDELVSLSKGRLTDFVGSLGSERTRELNGALTAALGLDAPSCRRARASPARAAGKTAVEQVQGRGILEHEHGVGGKAVELGNRCVHRTIRKGGHQDVGDEIGSLVKYPQVDNGEILQLEQHELAIQVLFRSVRADLCGHCL